MSIEAEISERAREIAEAMRERRSGLARKKADLEAELSQVTAEISTKDDIDERLAVFQGEARQRLSVSILRNVRPDPAGPFSNRKG